MPLLQQIKRTNGSLVHSVNIPIEVIEQVGWKKRELLAVEYKQVSPGIYIVIICKEADESKVKSKV